MTAQKLHLVIMPGDMANLISAKIKRGKRGPEERQSYERTRKEGEKNESGVFPNQGVLSSEQHNLN